MENFPPKIHFEKLSDWKVPASAILLNWFFKFVRWCCCGADDGVYVVVVGVSCAHDIIILRLLLLWLVLGVLQIWARYLERDNISTKIESDGSRSRSGRPPRLFEKSR